MLSIADFHSRILSVYISTSMTSWFVDPPSASSLILGLVVGMFLSRWFYNITFLYVLDKTHSDHRFQNGNRMLFALRVAMQGPNLNGKYKAVVLCKNLIRARTRKRTTCNYLLIRRLKKESVLKQMRVMSRPNRNRYRMNLSAEKVCRVTVRIPASSCKASAE